MYPEVINHGIPISTMKDALEAATEFFDLPMEEKMHLLSDDFREPVTYGTSINHSRDVVFFWRDFIKPYSHPISKWIHLWPSNPPSYREKMGNYTTAVQDLYKKLMRIVLETLGLNPNYFREDVEEGSQAMAVNCYPECPEPDLALGMPPNSDFGSLTILLQSSSGLQVLDKNGNWIPVLNNVEGALIVQLGDQMEVLSNGQYRSIVHRAMVNQKIRRLSLASIHSFPVEKKMGPALELVDEKHPMAYKEFSFQEFIDFASANEIIYGRFIDALKKNS